MSCHTDRASCALQEVLKSLHDISQKAIASVTNVETNNILPIRKQRKRLKNGDFVLPRGFIAVADDQKLARTVGDLIAVAKLPVSQVLRSEYNLLAFHLDRTKVFSAVLKEVKENDSLYGHIKNPQPNSIILTGINGTDVDALETMLDLRIAVLSCHIIKLLEANGHKVQFLNDCHENFESKTMMQSNKGEEVKGSCQSHFVSKAKANFSIESTTLMFSVVETVVEKGLVFGKDGFDKNLKNVEVLVDNQPTKVLESAIQLEDALSTMNIQEGHSPHFIHIVSQNQSFKHQQIQLLWNFLSNKEITMSQLIIGPVCFKPEISFDDFYKSRTEYAQEVLEERLGNDYSRTDDSKVKVETLTRANIKMDILGNAAHAPLRIDCSDKTGGRLGAFVMYNTARLAMLMSQFSQEVSKGVYPPLPEIEETDFSPLREEGDWELLFQYIGAFPNVVSQSVEAVCPTEGKNLTRIHTHKIANFLTSFVKCLSSYYSRFHILRGREKHLLPLMFARLHLMRAAHQVLVNCLALLEIPAPSCM